MSQTIQERESIWRQMCRQYDQEQLFAFWNQLDSAGRERLLNDLERVPFAHLPSLEPIIRAESKPFACASIEPAPFVKRPPDSRTHALSRRGETLLRESKVAAFTVAGGQGTRLGL